MNQSEGQEGRGWKILAKIHVLAYAIELVGVLAVSGATYLLGWAPSRLNLPLGESFILPTIAAAIFFSAAEIYRRVTRNHGMLISGQLALGLLRGWPDDKPAEASRSHKVLIVSDNSDGKAKEESEAAVKDIEGPGLQPSLFDPAKFDDLKKEDRPKYWQDASADVSAFYLLRTRSMVQQANRKWIRFAILELCKTRNIHSPVVEADVWPETPSSSVFFRISQQAFPKRMHVLLSRAIERAALMASQAAFNRFVLFLFLVGVVTVLLAGRLPFLFRPRPSADEMARLTDLVNSQHAERNLLEKCFPLATTKMLAKADCSATLGQIREATKGSISLALMHVSEAGHLPPKPRLTVWRRAEYRGHNIIFVAGASEDPGVHVFLDPPQSEGKANQETIIGGAFLIPGWVLWRAKCTGSEADAAWTVDGRVVGHCNEDGVIETTDGTKITFQPVPPPSVSLAALLCYGDAHGDGACIGVTDNARLLEDESLKRDVALQTSLIAGRPTSLLFGEDSRNRANQLLGIKPGE